MDYNTILDTPMGDNDAGAKTIRGYMFRLLIDVWEEQEGFNGKRPFGNSSWSIDVTDALAATGRIKATRDSYGDWQYDWREAEKIVLNALHEWRRAETF